jgi:hypothetical protein
MSPDVHRTGVVGEQSIRSTGAMASWKTLFAEPDLGLEDFSDYESFDEDPKLDDQLHD